MIDPRAWHPCVLELVFLPGEWSSTNVEEPYIIFGFVAGIASEYDEVGSIEDH